MSENKNLTINVGQSKTGRILFDEPLTGTNSNGAWYLYKLEVEADEIGFFATEGCHKQLSKYKKNDIVTISHNDIGGGKSKYVVSSDVAPSLSGLSEGSKPDWDKINEDKKEDIHRQVCLKLAVDLLGDVDGKLTPEQVGIVQHNLGALKMVLDHSVVKEDDLPF